MINESEDFVFGNKYVAPDGKVFEFRYITNYPNIVFVIFDNGLETYINSDYYIRSTALEENHNV